MDAAYSFAKNFVIRSTKIFRRGCAGDEERDSSTCGVALGGVSQPGRTHVCELVKEWGGKKRAASSAASRRVPAPNAAQANATMVHALDYDDVHELAVMHPGIASIPVVLAVAEAAGAS